MNGTDVSGIINVLTRILHELSQIRAALQTIAAKQ